MVALGSVWFSQYSGRALFIEGNLIVNFFLAIAEPILNRLVDFAAEADFRGHSLTGLVPAYLRHPRLRDECPLRRRSRRGQNANELGHFHFLLGFELADQLLNQ